MKAFLSAIALALAAVTAAPAQSVIGPAVYPPQNWSRGSSVNSTYQYWDIFTSPAGPNAPDAPSLFNPSGTPDVADSSGGSFITSGGNIYSPTAVLAIDVTVPNPGLGSGWFTTVVLQTQTLGTGIDPASVTLTDGAAVYAPFNSEQLFSVPLGGFGGNRVGNWYQFLVPGNSSSYLLEFAAAGSSMSLDRVSVDTFANFGSQIIEPLPSTVPEPTSLLLTGLAGAVGVWIRRRRWNRREDVS